MKINFYKRKAVSLIVIIFSILTIFGLASFSIDVGYILNCQNELQKSLESSCLAGASVVEPVMTSSGKLALPDNNDVKNDTKAAFVKIIDSNQLLSMNKAELLSSVAIESKRESKAVRIIADMTVQPFLISVLGIKDIKIIGRAAAMGFPVYLSPNSPKTPVAGSLANAQLVNPIGKNSGKGINNNINNIYYAPDGKGVSLGAGGLVVLRLPMALLDGPGFDFSINNVGNAKGYFVFAGVDSNPNNPFISSANPGAGITWQNISCTGSPAAVTDNSNSLIGAYNVVDNVGPYNLNYDAKFYGSGMFNLALNCSGNPAVVYKASVNSAQYLMIIDDGVEDGFLADNPVNPVLLIGDHSSITPGVTIDSIGLFHHTRLIKYDDYAKDTDNDNLIDILEDIVGTDKNDADKDTDNDGIEDLAEVNGWFYNGGSIKTLFAGPSSNKIYYTSPNSYDKVAGNGGIIVPRIKI